MLTEIYAFDPEMNLHSHFHFNSFPERERERKREREKREPKSEREREREEEETSPAIAPPVNRQARSSEDRTASRSTSDAIVRRACSLIAPLIDCDCECVARQSTSGAIDEQCDRPTSALVDCTPRRSRRSSNDHTDLAFYLAFTARSHLLLHCAIDRKSVV